MVGRAGHVVAAISLLVLAVRGMPREGPEPGGFTATRIRVGREPVGVRFADLNGDGLGDIVTADSADGTVTLFLSTGAGASRAALPAPSAADPPPVRPAGVPFEKDVGPLLARRCQPCHFPGGKMYEKLPFDDPATVRRLGEKLFTRIRDEKERELLRAFFAAPN